MSSGKHLRIQRNGTDAMLVRLEGNKAKPEPSTFIVAFPGGEVEIARCSDDTYWIHLNVSNPTQFSRGGPAAGRITDARLDIRGKHASDCNAGDFSDPNLYHVALKVAPLEEK